MTNLKDNQLKSNSNNSAIAEPSDADKLRHFEYVQEFANKLAELDDVDELIWYVCEKVIPNLDFDDCVIYLSDHSENVIRQKAAWGIKNPTPREVFNPIELSIGEGICGVVAEKGEIITVNDTQSDKRYRLDLEQGLSECAVPLFYEGEVIGVLDSENSKVNYFSTYHEQLLTTIAALISNRIGESLSMKKVANTIEKLRSAEKLQKSLFEIASLVHKSKDMQEFYERLHRIIGELLHVENFFIALYDEKSEVISFPYFVDTEDESPEDNASIDSMKRSLTFHCLQNRKPALFNDKNIVEMEKEFGLKVYGTLSKSWLGIPFILDENSSGIIVVQSYTDEITYTEEDRVLFDFVAQNLAATLNFKRSLYELKSLKDILPICSYCYKIRDDKDSWEQMESYISTHADTTFTHGVCPDCYEKARKELGLAIKKNKTKHEKHL